MGIIPIQSVVISNQDSEKPLHINKETVAFAQAIEKKNKVPYL